VDQVLVEMVVLFLQLKELLQQDLQTLDLAVEVVVGITTTPQHKRWAVLGQMVLSGLNIQKQQQRLALFQ
jgi:hypothetical protein